MRREMRIAIALFVVGAGVASANTGHHDVGGGGGGEAECIRWEPIPLDMAGRDMASVDMAGADMAGADMAGVDGGASDGGLAAPVPMRCVERASLFNCAAAPGGASDGGSTGIVALLAILALTLSRSRRRHG